MSIVGNQDELYFRLNERNTDQAPIVTNRQSLTYKLLGRSRYDFMVSYKVKPMAVDGTTFM